MAVDIVIVSYNGRALLRACLRSIEDTCAIIPDVSVFVVDNASTDGSPELVRDAFPAVRLIAIETNIGFGPANNRGFDAGQAPLVLFLNSDAELTPGALHTLIRHMEERPKCAIVGPALAYPDGRFQPSCRRFPSPLRDSWCLTGMESRLPNRARGLANWLSETEHEHARHVDMVSGACFLVRRDYLNAVGRFDENIFLYEEEMDISFPARRLGFTIDHAREAVVVHHHGGSSQGEPLREFTQHHAFRSKYYCFRKHYGPAPALATYLANRALFGMSALKNRLTNRPSPASTLFRLARQGYLDSRALRIPRHG